MSDLIIPTIGSSGFFNLRPPFDTLVLPGERYVCQGIRKISDYLANNEDPKADIYVKHQISEEEYAGDAAKDMVIVSLQSEKGHWLFVPARYIIGYPVVNGIPYRSLSIGVALPAMPAYRDLTFLKADITNLIKDSLGVVPVVKLVETSRVVLVPKDKHDLSVSNRTAVSNGRLTDRSRYMKLLVDHQAALDKIAELEAYIKTTLEP